MNAREYYYTKIAPEQMGKSYEAFYYESRKEIFSPDMADIFGTGGTNYSDLMNVLENSLRHQPVYSNNKLLEDNLREMMKILPVPISYRLQQMFVVKSKDYIPNAYAITNEKEYTGELVFFNVGLSDACYQYSILYSELQEFISKVGPNADRIKKSHDLKKITDMANNLAKAQKKWISEDDGVRLYQDSILETSSIETAGRAGGISDMSDRFILFHEIAHHLLGHLGESDVGTQILECVSQSHYIWNKTSTEHAKEYMADILALLISTGSIIKEELPLETIKHMRLNGTLGTLLTQTVLGQMSTDINRSSVIHPSVKDRYLLIMKFTDVMIPDDLLKYVCWDFIMLHSLLRHTQGHGLGELVDDEFDLFNFLSK